MWIALMAEVFIFSVYICFLILSVYLRIMHKVLLQFLDRPRDSLVTAKRTISVIAFVTCVAYRQISICLRCLLSALSVCIVAGHPFLHLLQHTYPHRLRIKSESCMKLIGVWDACESITRILLDGVFIAYWQRTARLALVFYLQLVRRCIYTVFLEQKWWRLRNWEH